MRVSHFLVLAIVFLACQPTHHKEPIRISGEAQGTTFMVLYHDSLNRDFSGEIDSMLQHIDYSLSTYQPNSVISMFNNRADSEAVFVDTFGYFLDVYNWCERVFTLSGGAFDPTVMPLVQAWGFGLKKREQMDSAKVDSILPLVGFNKNPLLFSNPNQGPKTFRCSNALHQTFDFNSIAQGWSVDLIARFLNSKGIKNFLVEIGGEVVCKGKKAVDKSWTAGIEKPSEDGSREVKYAVEIFDEAIATSGNYRKFYEIGGKKYAHTLNPKTGFPVQHNVLSATVIAPNATLADAYATMCMVIGLEETQKMVPQLQKQKVEVLLLYADDNGHLKHFVSSGFPTLN